MGFFRGDQQDGPKTAEEQSPDERALVAFIRNRVDESRRNAQRVSWESTFLTNVAYVLGFDSVYYDSKLRSYRPIGGGSQSLTRTMLKTNKILPSLQNRTARLCKSPVKYEVRPDSQDNADKDAARLGIDILNDIWNREQCNEKRIQLMMMMQEAGWSYIKVCWDETKGKFLEDPADGEGFFEGDVSVEATNPLEIFNDPLAKSLKESLWVVQAKIRKLDYFREQYPERGMLVKAEGAWLQSLDYEIRLNNLGPSGPSATTTDQQMRNAAIELCYYEKPTKKHPQGRMIISANGVLLEDKELPIGEIPFAKFDDVVIGGRFAAEAVVTHVRSIQDQHTRLIRKRAQWTNRMLAGKMSAPKGHGIQQEGFNDQSGEIVEWNIQPNAPNGGEPKQLPVPAIPQYAYMEEERLDKQFDEVFGLNELSKGQLPAAGIPAKGMEILLEQDATRMSIMTQQHEFAWSDVGRFILKYVEKYYKSPRLLKITGKNRTYSVSEYTGEDLQGNHDVQVVPGSLIPGNKYLDRQEILNAYNSGLLGDPMDQKLRQKVLSMMEYGDIQEMWQDLASSIAQAQRFLDMLKKGIQPEINEFDNHGILFQEINRARITEGANLHPVIKLNIDFFLNRLVDYGVKMASPTAQSDRELAEQMVGQHQNVDAAMQGAQSPDTGGPGAAPPQMIPPGGH